jgi:putative flippase GtrA
MKTVVQLFRFGIIGLSSNALLYLLYLAITVVGVGHKTSMTIVYALGVCITFAFNRNWSFQHGGVLTTSFKRYVATYLTGYLVNWVVLFYLVDYRGWPHQWVQPIMILVLAAGLFLSQKFWVFREEPIL